MSDDVARLHLHSKIYEQLYREQDAIDVLKQSAPAAFRVFQVAIADGLEIGIARLLDPAHNQQQRNLTLDQLANLLRQQGHRALASQLSTNAGTLKKAADALLKARHKRHAHRDLDVALGSAPFPATTWELVSSSVKKLGDLMNDVEPVVTGQNSATAYGYVSALGDGEALLRVLKGGLEARATRRALRESSGS